jgi:hypothetical protein
LNSEFKGISASKSALLLSPCIAWAHPSAKHYEDEFANTAKRDIGTDFHALMDMWIKRELHHVVSSPRKEPCDDVSILFEVAKKWARQALDDVEAFSIQSEVYVAINPHNGVPHYDNTVKDRNYPNVPGFIPGTCDLVYVCGDGTLVVSDWKTGGGNGADEQLLTLAAGLRNIYRKADGSLRPVRISVLYVSHDGVIDVSRSVSHDELDAHLFALSIQLDRVGSLNNRHVVSVNCTQLYCPHLAYCPAIKAKTAELSGDIANLDVLQDNEVNSSNAGKLMSVLTAAKRRTSYWENKVRAFSEGGGVVRSGGYTFSKKSDGFRWRKDK